MPCRCPELRATSDETCFLPSSCPTLLRCPVLRATSVELRVSPSSSGTPRRCPELRHVRRASSFTVVVPNFAPLPRTPYQPSFELHRHREACLRSFELW